jgi:CRISPR-associated endonuclease Cas2
MGRARSTKVVRAPSPIGAAAFSFIVVPLGKRHERLWGLVSVQKSVFECDLSEAQCERMRGRLLRAIAKDEDNLRLYRLREPRESSVEEYGVARTIDFRGPLVV